jgi:F-type H+-transporting ATPase subunit b
MSQICISKKFSGFLILTALTVGVALAPLSMAAQEAPKPQEAAAQSATTTPEAAKPTQEEQNEAFLTNGSLVKWTAKTLNVTPKTASNICLFINFGILILLVGIPLAKITPKVLRKRGQTVLVNIADARKATEEAKARLGAIETKLAGLGAEIDQIRAQVEQESKQDEVRIKATIDEEKARIVASAEQEITMAAAQARRELQHFATDLAIDQAATQLNLSPEADQALIAEFIRGANGKTSGGQN